MKKQPAESIDAFIGALDDPLRQSLRRFIATMFRGEADDATLAADVDALLFPSDAEIAHVNAKIVTWLLDFYLTVRPAQQEAARQQDTIEAHQVTQARAAWAMLRASELHPTVLEGDKPGDRAGKAPGGRRQSG